MLSVSEADCLSYFDGTLIPSYLCRWSPSTVLRQGLWGPRMSRHLSCDPVGVLRFAVLRVG